MLSDIFSFKFIVDSKTPSEYCTNTESSYQRTKDENKKEGLVLMIRFLIKILCNNKNKLRNV